ncbi:nucleoside transporter [Sporothrix schenckii 1099-18]|uniref:Nucleoside transporter n=1 Tax=Sporothrix schenckii 1099-18 TaxID=1397361 RepID=A0A0F2M2B3_SPOSC|nr:nucleoside transporter [Sporothrix schenckii 1099-18]KJR83234.1 nucleoside transporter [Sporothrix schenckii 1099-18]
MAVYNTAEEEKRVGVEENVLPTADNSDKIGDATESSSDNDLPSYLRSSNAVSRFFATLRSYENALDRKIGVESAGITRRRPEDRDPNYARWSNQAVMYLLWMSTTMNISCFTTGFLGWEFGLDLSRNVAIIVFATLLGSAVTGWCATMGPGMGLRQVSISRYSIGWWPSKVIAALNVVEQVGWSSVGSITGGLALSAVSDGKIGSQLGVVIAAVIGFVISFVGLRAVFTYEKFAGLVLFVVFIIMYGETAHYGDSSIKTKLTGATLSGTALTLFAVVYGSSASWCSIVADYYVEYPVNTSKLKVFLLTTAGICLPTCFGMCLGAAVASSLDSKPDWSDAYDEGIGFLIQIMLHPKGFAKFLLVILALSGIAMNAVALYSAGLSVQQFARPLGAVPRFIWTALMFVAVILLALVGRDHLLSFLENFLSLLGYWNTSFFIIIFLEHYLFRKGFSEGYDNYDLESWNNPKRMPFGWAGGLAFAAGIAGCVLGMSETWYVGVLARKIGDTGGDIGNQLAFLFTFVVYIPARWAEYKYTGL